MNSTHVLIKPKLSISFLLKGKYKGVRTFHMFHKKEYAKGDGLGVKTAQQWQVT